MSMGNERWDLISECDPKKLGHIVTFIFSDEYIYTHPRLRKQMQADRKGYLHLSLLFSQSIIQQYFKLHQIQSNSKLSLLREAVSGFCQGLVLRGNRVRRIVPFNCSLYINVRPVSIDKLEEALTISDVRHFLGESAFSQAQQFDMQNDTQFMYIYAPDYRQRLGGHMPFRLLDYQKLCIQRERQSRYWDQQEKRFYMSRTQEGKAREQGHERYRGKRGMEEQEDLMGDNTNHEPRANLARTALQPNPIFNQQLASYILAAKERLDQE